MDQNSRGARCSAPKFKWTVGTDRGWAAAEGFPAGGEPRGLQREAKIASRPILASRMLIGLWWRGRRCWGALQVPLPLGTQLWHLAWSGIKVTISLSLQACFWGFPRPRERQLTEKSLGFSRTKRRWKVELENWGNRLYRNPFSPASLPC